MAAEGATEAPLLPEPAGYKGFGSFHSDDVEELIRIPETEYSPPEVSAVVKAKTAEVMDMGASPPEFGSHLRSSAFLLDPEWTFINHGAFGGAARGPFSVAQAWRERCDSQPLRFIDRELFPHMVHSVRELAKFVGCAPVDMVPLPNVTTGLNAVFKSAGIREGDTVFMLDIGYGSAKKMLRHICGGVGATLIEHRVKFPISTSEDLIRQISAAVTSDMRLVVLDHITSNTGIVLPIKELCAVCKEKNVPVLIDGAHSLLMQPLCVADIGADYFLSNCHKWLCAPKGAAFMYVHPDRRGTLDPAIISHGIGSGMLSSFVWDGCRDYSPFLVIPMLLQWWKWVGVDRAREYCLSLMKEATSLLVTEWSSDMFVPLEMCGMMALVRVPDSVSPPRGKATSTHAKHLQDKLHFVDKIECPVKCIDGTLYVRISVFVYNDISDFRKLALAVKTFISAL